MIRVLSSSSSPSLVANIALARNAKRRATAEERPATT
jgi:hypothetical protein